MVAKKRNKKRDDKFTSKQKHEKEYTKKRKKVVRYRHRLTVEQLRTALDEAVKTQGQLARRLSWWDHSNHLTFADSEAYIDHLFEREILKKVARNDSKRKK